MTLGAQVALSLRQISVHVSLLLIPSSVADIFRAKTRLKLSTYQPIRISNLLILVKIRQFARGEYLPTSTERRRDIAISRNFVPGWEISMLRSISHQPAMSLFPRVSRPVKYDFASAQCSMLSVDAIAIFILVRLNRRFRSPQTCVDHERGLLYVPARFN